MESEMHDWVKPISWLIGTWKSTNGVGLLATGTEFSYHETVEFETSGKQPLLKYTAKSTNPVSKEPMHLESGFLRAVSEDTKLAMMVAHNFGVVGIEEGGEVGESEILLRSLTINRMTSAQGSAVLNTERRLKLDIETGIMIQEVWMATSVNPKLSKHLTASYIRD